LFKYSANQKNIKLLLLHIDETIPQFLVGDAYTKQILVNLLSNAIKFTQKEVKLEISQEKI
jgi:signal transduction histidine kinase